MASQIAPFLMALNGLKVIFSTTYHYKCYL